jgi:hypothetical protein
MRKLALAFAILLLPGVAAAQDEPRFCPNRPDLGSGACTTDPGRMLLELSSADWQLDRQGGEREDQLLVSDALLRTGIDARTEFQLGWTPLARVRQRDASGVDTVVGTGDVRLGVRRNLRNPDGHGFAVAVEPFVTLPTGDGAIGRGDWSAGVVVPVGWEIGDWSLAFTGEGTAEVDEDRDGRHLAYAGTLGLGRALSDTVGAVIEIAARRDDDPSGGETELLTAASLAWEVRENAQLDLLAVAGLNRSSPDVRLVFGGAILF